MANATRTRNKSRDVVVNPPANPNPELDNEVPVRRIAEYIPASFIATSDGDDVLNDSEARIYKVSDHVIALAFNAGVLEFNIEALEMVCERVKTMSDTDLAEVLGLADDEDDDLD